MAPPAGAPIGAGRPGCPLRSAAAGGQDEEEGTQTLSRAHPEKTHVGRPYAAPGLSGQVVHELAELGEVAALDHGHEPSNTWPCSSPPAAWFHYVLLEEVLLKLLLKKDCACEAATKSSGVDNDVSVMLSGLPARLHRTLAACGP